MIIFTQFKYVFNDFYHIYISCATITTIQCDNISIALKFPHDSAVPLLGLYPKDMKTDTEEKTCS